ncbi:MAG: hypothetical protein KZQ70_01950 [gamma proteobacterium symbiont of Lucinoma myriamae]|nr:hypothetical protein [gamma proteobacterium symbiont of Lucinoma myriamae]
MNTDLETQIIVDILNLEEVLKKAVDLNRHQDVLNMYQCMIEVKNDELEQFKSMENIKSERTLTEEVERLYRFC